ncbi:polymorphic toxin-type HINT domain-containing protein [Actinomadura sp. 6N118]|uniref:polymorphic toxin-type HINT domain-containing protein n=1 Tax=Actinomadura sp. 6N118 TaxID=3375151 RepID=UPI0037A4F635
MAPTDQTQAGKVALHLDYSKFAHAAGGAYASRLRLVQLPACALVTPDKPECRSHKPVPTRNDTESKRLIGEIDVASRGSSASAGQATVLAVTAGASSSQGDYNATSLSPSSSGNVSTNTGDFTWSYPLRVPPVPGGLQPDLALSYNSGGIDGRTANSNNQSSWAGDGFELWPGYVQRGYKSCEDDGAPKDEWGVAPADQCWGYDNATLSLNGHSGELIPAGGGKYRLKNDDGTRVERLTGTDANTDNGDDDNEYWKVTTTDGTQYFFGKHKLEGWTSGNPVTNSAWTAPVFGNNSTEPCHAAAFKDSSCPQAYRWNLDYVVDRDGNAITYYYAKETNHYGRNLKASDETPYVRGGYLSRVEYGLRKDNLWASRVPAAVEFEVAERCLPNASFNCDPDKIDAQRAQWQDTPWDLNCKSGQECKDDHGTLAPTFWSRYRLLNITTKVIEDNGMGWRNVDNWKLGHKWGDADPERSLLLETIQHTGLAATPSVTLPKVTLAYHDSPNRVDKAGDNTGPFIKYRLVGVSDESGGQTAITYKTAECNADNLPTPHTNTKRCFPVYWVHNGGEDPKIDWFHKYVVDNVQTTDRTGLAPNVVTTYDYKGGAAWHFDDDDGLTKEKYKTWSQWRGYGHVQIRTGGWNDPRTQSDHFFLRGMDADRAVPDTDLGRIVKIDDGEGGTIIDHNVYAGFEYRTVNYERPGGAVAAKSVRTPWNHQTASRTRSWGTVTANLSGVSSTRAFTAVGGGGWRETRVNNTFDVNGNGGTDTPIGRVTMSEDLGDVSTATDDRCTRTTYKDNTGDWLLSFPNRVETVAVKCSTTPSRATKPDGQPGHVISDVRTSYDEKGWNVAPTKGSVTLTERLTSHDGTTPTYKRVTATKYDDLYGRQTEVTDAKGNTTRTSYEDPQGLTTRTTVTSPRTKADDADSAHVTVTDYDTASGKPLTRVDPALKRTDTVYDALGRLVKVWFPDRPKARGLSPNLEYTYQVEEGKIIAIGTKNLTATGAQKPPTYQLYDGLLRPRQTQGHGPGGNKIVAETLYNNVGKAERVYAPYYEKGAPSPVLWGVTSPGATETQTKYVYDGLGRVTKEALINGGGDGAQMWATIYDYEGDRVSVTPPKGGTPTISISDARGQLTEQRQYHASTPTGDDYDITRYTYAPGGQLKTLTGPVNSKTGGSGKTWTTYYDQVGRKTRTDDPDKGTTKYSYDDLDRLTSVTDARDQKVITNYDVLNRVTSTTDGAGSVLTSNVYDTVAKGQLTSSTRKAKDRNGNIADYTTTVAGYDNLYRPTGTTLTIPASEGVGTSFTFTSTFNADGTPKSTGMPAAGDLPGEAVTFGYSNDLLALPETLDSNLSSYVTDSLYTPTGKPLQYELTTGAKKTWLSYEYEVVTQRTSRFRVTRQDIPTLSDRDATYKYDDAGNILQVADISAAGQDTQCFRYDHLRRLTDAWSQDAGNCPTDTSTTPTIGGPAPYRATYTYATDGSRKGEKQYFKDAVGTAQTATRAYAYAGEPGVTGYNGHQLANVVQSGTSPYTGATGRETFTYDQVGNTATRNIAYTDNGTPKSRTQTFDYDTEGEISSITQEETGKAKDTSTFVYGTEGGRLIKRDSTGVTLYLPGMEVKLAAGATTPTATRYYSYGGNTIATRTSAGVTFLAPDHQGTSLLTIGAADQKLTQRRTTPFGQERSTTGTWPTSLDKGFVGGTKDTTGLTHLGAREYDPNTGRFTTVDPIFDASNPQSWNGYSYANNSPITFSDPTGLRADEPNEAQCRFHGKCKKPSTGTNPDPPSPGGGGGGTNPPANKNWWQKGIIGHGVNAFNGWVDGAITSATEGITNLSRAMMGLGAIGPCAAGSSAGCQIVAKTSQQPAPVHVPLGGDTNSKTYKVAKVIGEVTGVPLPSAGATGGVRAATKAPGLIKRAVNALRRTTPTKTLTEAECFVAGTKIATEHGSKPIEKIKVGDRVWSRDTATGKLTLQRVVRLFQKKTDRLITLKVAGQHIKVTPDHRIWVNGKGWTHARNLAVGDKLLQANGRTATIAAVGALQTNTTVYNFEVENTHNYYVTDAKLLVHNDCGPGLPNQRSIEIQKIELKTAADRGVKPVTLGEGAGMSGLKEAIGGASDFKWAVTMDDDLKVMPAFAGGGSGGWPRAEIAHTVLAGLGARVRAAGSGTFMEGFPAFINNHSGHFMPGAETLPIGEAAFERAGIDYISSVFGGG